MTHLEFEGTTLCGSKVLLPDDRWLDVKDVEDITDPCPQCMSWYAVGTQIRELTQRVEALSRNQEKLIAMVSQ